MSDYVNLNDANVSDAKEESREKKEAKQLDRLKREFGDLWDLSTGDLPYFSSGDPIEIEEKKKKSEDTSNFLMEIGDRW